MKYANTIIIGALLIILFVMSVGYAAFATQLELNGTAKIQGEWDVEITKIEPTSVVGTAEAGTPTNTVSSATFDALLKAPGDSVTYTVTIENKGTIDAKLDSATYTEQTDGSPAIVYTTTEPGETLAAGATTTATVTATYDASVTEVPEVTTKTITGIYNYVQK